MKPYSSLHFIGIGGAGMSGIARLFLSRGVHVTGSMMESDRIADLSDGEVINIGLTRKTSGPLMVAVSSAMPRRIQVQAAHHRSIRL